jgi:hypothetical protein
MSEVRTLQDPPSLTPAMGPRAAAEAPGPEPLSCTIRVAPVAGSNHRPRQVFGPVAQMGERRLRKSEVVGSIPIGSTIHARDRLAGRIQVEGTRWVGIAPKPPGYQESLAARRERLEAPAANQGRKNIATPTARPWALSSDGRAPALHAGGRRFDPDRVHHFAALARRTHHSGSLTKPGTATPTGVGTGGESIQHG